MAAEDAGSIFSEVRIRLDKLKADIVEATTFLDKFEKGVPDAADKASKKATSSFNAMSLAAVAASAAIVNAFRSMITVSAQYGQAMSNVQAATRGTSKDLADLEGAAAKAGDELATSTTDALGAVEALAKAGVSTADIMGGALPGALTLAAAGSMNVSDAAEIAAATMTQFGLKGKDVTHIADLLAAGAGKAQGEVSDLSQALKQAGLVASQTGLSVDDTVGSLAAFASAGLLGSDAGTSFRTMLLRLTPQSKEAADEMKKLGLNAFDAKGEFIGITAFAGQLQTQLKGLTTEQRNSALATIFGSDSIRAANVLYTQGAEGIAGWISKVNDAGFAADTAKIKLDNLNGDLKRFGAATTDAGAALGKSLNPALRGVTQFGTAFFELISKIPEPLLTFIGTIGALGGGFLAIVAAGPPVIATIVSIGTAAAAALGPIGLIATGITLVGGAVVATAKALDDAAIAEGLRQFGDMGRQAGLSGTELDTFAKITLNAKNAIEGLSEAQQKMFTADRFKALAENTGLTNDQLAQVIINSNGASESIKKLARTFIDKGEQAKRDAAADAKNWDAMEQFYGKRFPKVVEDGSKQVTAGLSTISQAIALQNQLEKDGIITTKEALEAKIKLREDEIDKIMKTAAATGGLTTAQEDSIRKLKAFNVENQAALDSITNDKAWETQTALMEEFYARDAEALSQKEKDEADAWATQNALMDEFNQRDAEASAEQAQRRKEIVDLTVQTFSALATSLASIFASLNQQEIDNLDATYAHQKELIENNGMTKKQALEKSLADANSVGDAQAIADAKRALDLFNIEADYTRQKAQLQYQAAHTQWMFQVALATASAARAIAEALPNIPLSILAGVIGAVQVGATIAAEPQPPKFATGGIVLPSGQEGRQITAGDGGGGDILFGTAAAGAPLMQAFADMVSSRVALAVGNSSGNGRPIQLIMDGKVIAQGVVDWVNSGQVRLK